MISIDSRCRDPPRKLRPRHHAPCALDAFNLDHAAAVCCHRSADLRVGKPRHHGLPARAGEPEVHEFIIRVLVVDHEQPTITPAFERNEPDEVVVVAELRLLARSRGIGRIELRCTRQHRIAPANEDVSVIAGSNVVGLVGSGANFCEGEAGFRRRLSVHRARRLCHRQRHHRRAHDRNGQSPAHEIAPGQALRQDISHRRIRRRIGRNILPYVKRRVRQIGR